MPDIIDFFERMGQDADLRRLDGASLEQALLRAKIDARVCAAVVSPEPRRLAAVLNAPTNRCPLVEESEGEAEKADAP